MRILVCAVARGGARISCQRTERFARSLWVWHLWHFEEVLRSHMETQAPLLC